MRNNTLSEKIASLVSGLPYFSLADLILFKKNKHYLKIFLSRYEKKGKLFRLKKGIYVSKEYIDEAQKKGALSPYLEFAANILYSPSYLSLEYILYRHNILTELPKNYTSVSLNKTFNLSNKFGAFFYHKIKRELFLGFENEKVADFIILKATKAKALFDFLYFRKNILINKEAVSELRLNLDNLKKADIREFKKYLDIDGSKKMKEIFNYLF